MTHPDFGDFLDTVDSAATEFIQTCKNVTAKELNLDPRCGSMWVCDGAIICQANRRGSLDYYGGFEYVDKENITVIGNYVFYSSGDSRVNEHLDYYIDNQEGDDDTAEDDEGQQEV